MARVAVLVTRPSIKVILLYTTFTCEMCVWSPEGVQLEKLGRGVRPTSQNPDQNLQYSLPYLLPGDRFLKDPVTQRARNHILKSKSLEKYSGYWLLMKSILFLQLITLAYNFQNFWNSHLDWKTKQLNESFEKRAPEHNFETLFMTWPLNQPLFQTCVTISSLLTSDQC